MRCSSGWARWLAAVIVSLVFTATAIMADSGFDHFTTGFPLSGGHAFVDCANCHVNGMFRGTPDRCVACHAPGGIVSASTKTPNHIASSNRCDNCHTGQRWNIGVRTDHSLVSGSCFTCHNGVRGEGKPARHVASSNRCADCHNTLTWRNARFDHSTITGTCFSCHNGTTARSKGARHIAASNNCDDCHTTRAWKPARFDHGAVAAGTCSTCHNGVQATGKHARHVATTAQCDVCHSTHAWSPARFDHATVGAGTCNGCHNGTQATGKPAGHFITSRSCDQCHTRTAWTPGTFRHTSPGYPGDHRRALSCSSSSCHGGKTEAVTWPAPAYKPACAACHAKDYKPDAHKNATVSALRNCAGTCHVSTPEHRITDGDF